MKNVQNLTCFSPFFMHIYLRKVEIGCFLFISKVIIIADVISKSNVHLHILHVILMQTIGWGGGGVGFNYVNTSKYLYKIKNKGNIIAYFY